MATSRHSSYVWKYFDKVNNVTAEHCSWKSKEKPGYVDSRWSSSQQIRVLKNFYCDATAEKSRRRLILKMVIFVNTYLHLNAEAVGKDNILVWKPHFHSQSKSI